MLVVFSNRDDLAVPDGDRFNKRRNTVRRNLRIMNDRFCRHETSSIHRFNIFEKPGQGTGILPTPCPGWLLVRRGGKRKLLFRVLGWRDSDHHRVGVLPPNPISPKM